MFVLEKKGLLVVVIEVVVAVFYDQRLEVVLDGVEAFLESELSKDSGGALALAVSADGAVANVAARGALPVGILQGHPGVLAVPVPQADAAELSADAETLAGPADGLHVQRLLATLVTGGARGAVVNLFADVVAHVPEHVLRDLRVNGKNTFIYCLLGRSDQTSLCTCP